MDPRQLQISLTGFLEKNTSLFCRELWQLLISANQTGTGIPQRFLDEKAEELRRQKEEQERVQVGSRRGAPGRCRLRGHVTAWTVSNRAVPLGDRPGWPLQCAVPPQRRCGLVGEPPCPRTPLPCPA